MTTLTDSIKYVDESLDVGFKEFNTFMDNNVYSVRKDIEDTIFSYTKMALDTLRGITGTIRKTIDMIMAIPIKIARELQAIIDRIMNELLNFNFWGWPRYVMNELKIISGKGVKDFLLSSIAAGSVVLCANMDILKDLVSGWKVDESILAGLFMELSLDWLNRSCKDITHREEMNMSNTGKLETVYPYPGVEYEPDEALFCWSGITGGYFDAINGSVHPDTIPKSKEEIRIDLAGKKSIFQIQEEMGDIETMEDKYAYIFMLEELAEEFEEERWALRSTPNYSEEEMRLLELKGNISRVIPSTRQKLANASNLSNSKDVLGSFIKNLPKVDLSKIPQHKYNEIEKAIIAKLGIVKELAKGPDFTTRKHGHGQFTDFDFDPIFELFTDEELEYMQNAPRDKRVYRLNSLHPTTEMFIKDGVYYAPKNDFDAVGI